MTVRAAMRLAVGAGLGYFATDNGALFRGKEVIQVDIDPPDVSEGVRAATSWVRGDAATAVAAIDAELEARGHQAAGFRTAETAARLASPLPEYPAYAPEPAYAEPAGEPPVGVDADPRRIRGRNASLSHGTDWRSLVPEHRVTNQWRASRESETTAKRGAAVAQAW